MVISRPVFTVELAFEVRLEGKLESSSREGSLRGKVGDWQSIGNRTPTDQFESIIT